MSTSPPDRLTVTTSQELSEGKTAVFTFRDPASGLLIEGFVIRFEGRLHAYQNQCRHQPLTLDYGDGSFLTDDGRYLLCRNHGALFEPGTGRCVAGPCLNASLYPIAVAEEDGRIIVDLPRAEDVLELE